LPSDLEIAMSRVFDAPRALVWDAYTQPALVKRWLGVFAGWSLPVCEIDLRVGGAYHYEWLGPAGERMGMGGIYREIARPERIVQTEKFDDAWYLGEAEGTVSLTEKSRKTTLTITVRYGSKETRDAVLKSPMADGMNAGWDALDTFLAASLSTPGAVMIDTPEIVQTQVQAAAVIHITVARNKIQEVMGPGLNELMTTLKQQGVEPAGRWFAHHLKMGPKQFDFELGVPVAAPVTPQGRVKPGTLPAATIARTHYRGPYEGLPGAWPELESWIKAQGRESAADLWEVYVIDPSVSPDPATWTTQLNRPLLASTPAPAKKPAAKKPAAKKPAAKKAKPAPKAAKKQATQKAKPAAKKSAKKPAVKKVAKKPAAKKPAPKAKAKAKAKK
jgi:uncharacterized protein YndB with AHSA1/START domain/effector-binding domain-containing protein